MEVRGSAARDSLYSQEQGVQESTDAKDHQVQWLIDALRQEFCKDGRRLRPRAKSI